jgi:hypothetical protein
MLLIKLALSVQKIVSSVIVLIPVQLVSKDLSWVMASVPNAN